jgi:hypothetical protein
VANRRLSGILLHDRASPASLGLFRICVFSVWFLYLLLDQVHLLGLLPPDAFSAPGILRVIPEGLWQLALSEGGLTVFRLVIIGGVLVVILGVLPYRLVTIGVAILLVLYQGILRGFSGHMNHAELLLLYAAVVIAIFPCFDGLSVRKPKGGPHDRSQYAAPLLIMAFLFCFTFSFVGAARLSQGPDFFYTQTLRNLILKNWIQMGGLSTHGFAPPAAPFLPLEILPGPILQASYAVASLLELLAPLALISRRFRQVFAVFVIVFHTSTAYAMGVPFFENLPLIVVFSEKWFHLVAARLERGTRGARLKISSEGLLRAARGRQRV